MSAILQALDDLLKVLDGLLARTDLRGTERRALRSMRAAAAMMKRLRSDSHQPHASGLGGQPDYRERQMPSGDR